jgi:hypothetical protein
VIKPSSQIIAFSDLTALTAIMDASREWYSFPVRPYIAAGWFAGTFKLPKGRVFP